MAKCLIALGSNLGEREATLEAAVAALATTPGIELTARSSWHRSMPVGMPDSRHEFLNGAAAVETDRDPAGLLQILELVQSQLGRRSTRRLADRTIDLDLLLYDDCVLATPKLLVPHPRMSFRRFVLEPACEIAGGWVHPTIGWTLEQLLRQLDEGADQIAVVSMNETARNELAAALEDRHLGQPIAPPFVDPLWPAALTTWLQVREATAGRRTPKLSILVDPDTADAAWTTLAQQKGRGPTLRLAPSAAQRMEQEALAAVEAVWPRLGSAAGQRVE